MKAIRYNQQGAFLPEFTLGLYLFISCFVMVGGLIGYSFISIGIISATDNSAAYASSFSNEFNNVRKRSNKRVFVPNEEQKLKAYFLNAFDKQPVFKYMNINKIDVTVSVHRHAHELVNTCQVIVNCLTTPTHIEDGTLALFNVTYKNFGIPYFGGHFNVFPDLNYSYLAVIEHYEEL